MRIIVNDISAEKGGALTVLKSFYNYIVEYDRENEYIFLLSGRFLKETDRIKIIIRDDIKKSGFHKLKFDLFSGKKFIENLKPDYVLSLQNIITFGLKVRQGVYVHQSIPFQKEKNFSLLNSAERSTAVIQKLIGFFIKRSVIKANQVFVQTKWMKYNVAEKCGIPKDKITIVPFHSDFLESSVKMTVVPKNSFFYPATAESIYKNHSCIYQAINILNQEGIKDFSVKLTLHSPETKRNNLSYCGMLKKDELFEEYSKSILLFPSYIETIGLPLLEAKNANAVVFVASCEYAKEVLKGYPNTYYFDPFKPESLARLMKQAFEGKIIIHDFINSTEENATWNILIDKIKKK